MVNENDFLNQDGQDALFEKYITGNHGEAEKLLNDEDKLEKFLQKLENKLKTVPVAGTSLAYVPVMISLVRAYLKREYTEPPVVSLVSIIAALIYVLSPVDLIPDFVTGFGYTDDAVVVAGCLALVKTDIQDYMIWREKNGKEFKDLPNYEEIEKEAKENNKLLNVFIKGKNSKTKL